MSGQRRVGINQSGIDIPWGELKGRQVWRPFRGGGLFDGCSRELAAMPHACFISHPGFQACVVVDGPCPPLGEWRTLLFDSVADA